MWHSCICMPVGPALQSNSFNCLVLIPHRQLGSYWSSTRSEVTEEVQLYWLFRDYMAVIDGIDIKGRRIVLPISLPKTALEQLHINHMGIDKVSLLARNVYIGLILMLISKIPLKLLNMP